MNAIYPASSKANRTNFNFTIRTEKEGDIAVIEEVYTGDCYRLASAQLPPTPIIIDIGAHIGTFSVLARQRWPEARIYAFEPNKRSFELLQCNAGSLGVTCINAAVSYTQGALLTDGIGATGGGFMTTQEGFERMAAGKEHADGFIYEIMYEDVETVTIEQIAERYGIDRIGFAKWDCEGGEIDCMLHMSDEAAALFRGPMVGEYHVDDGEDYYTFERLASGRFSQHRFTGRSEENMRCRIGAFFAEYMSDKPQ